MSKLPEKAVLDGSKIPKTTTGVMKEALGELHDYLKELLGEDSGDKESARLALGIDLEELSGNIDAKADRSELSSVAMTGSYDDLKDKPDLSERGVPIGTVAWFAMPVPPAGYLKCDGSAVGRETCPELFAAIGTTFGAGDGETTFNLPNLIGRFAEGSATPGTVKEAGLPNITGRIGLGYVTKEAFDSNRNNPSLDGCFKMISATDLQNTEGNIAESWFINGFFGVDASLSNPTYGKSDTVQPPALTLLPCIKAFDAAVDSGLIDITELANEVAGKADTNLSNLSATGKAKAAHLAMPSGDYVGLSIPVTNTDVTAPADGYFYSVIFATAASNGYMNFINRSTGFGVMSNVPASSAEKHFMPVRKGDVVRVEYNNLSEETTFGFFYAEGSQP